MKYKGSKKVRENKGIIKLKNWDINIQDCLDEYGNKMAEKIVKLTNYIVSEIDLDNKNKL